MRRSAFFRQDMPTSVSDVLRGQFQTGILVNKLDLGRHNTLNASPIFPSRNRFAGGVRLKARLGISLDGDLTDREPGKAFRGSLRMGTHRVNKSPGDEITVSVAYTIDAKDVKGNNIAWPFSVSMDLIDKLGAIRNIVEGSVGPGGPTPTPASWTTTRNMVLPSVAATGDLFTVRVRIRAPASDELGLPTGIIVDVAQAVHANAVEIGTLAATRTAVVGTINVSRGWNPLRVRR